MFRAGSNHDPRTNEAVDLLMRDPTQSVPQAMLAAGFTLAESRDRAKQMRIRRRIPSKRRKDAGGMQPTNALSSGAVVSSQPPHHHQQQQQQQQQQNLSAEAVFGVAVATESAAIPDSEFECALQDWINFHRDDIIGRKEDEQSNPMIVISMSRKYLEQTVQILYALACKIVDGGVSNGGNSVECADEKILIHPDFITVENVIVRNKNALSLFEQEENAQISADFIRSDNSSFRHERKKVETETKHAVMHALAQIAYSMCLRGDGPRLPDFFPRNCITSSEASIATALSLQDDAEGGVDEETELMEMMCQRFRAAESEEMNGSGLNSTMFDAGIPLPMRRFISDLLGDEHEGILRSESAFASFEDVISDLKQMIMNPERFLHGVYSDRWKIVFDDKLYGREAEAEALMIVANRVARVRNEGAQSERLNRLAGKKSEVVMVSGHSGAGKSRLVRVGGTCLEKKGWIFLRCKFDQVAHPEPLSYLTHSLDAYLRSLALCPMHEIHRRSGTLSSHTSTECSCSGRAQDVRARLEHMIFPQGLGMLAKHIPSLKLLLDVAPPLDCHGLNESMMASLFRKLFQAISSKQMPILLFLDDLQWADTLSLSLLVEIIKEASPYLNLSVSNISDTRISSLDEEACIMFVGSYRDNEVGNTHPLAKVLCKFRDDDLLNVTEISLSGLSRDSLNEMLSDTLSLPNRRIRPLSELVIQKTGGHPLHVIEFIQALTNNYLLTHSFSKGWEWDEDSIDIFPITDSVAELYSFKLRRLQKDILLGIQILSCFGFQVNQQVLDLVAGYDGQDSVDMKAVLQVATGEGLIERAGPLISFSHDMILKAAKDSIRVDDLNPLLRKLVTVLIEEASTYDTLDAILFVAVDLINRMGSDLATASKERALFAELNLRAGIKALAVPDFAGAARYAENGISFLSDTCWETQYELCIQLYEISVLSLFPSLTGDRRKLMHRINDVFEHARDFTDKFKTHIVWVQLLAASDLMRAIEECLIALDQLGEPLNLADVDHNRVCFELAKQNKLRIEGLILTKRSTDVNRMRAMEILSLLFFLCCQTKSFHAALISCKMVELSLKYGTCEESVHGIAAFASALINIAGYIGEGINWGRTAQMLLKSFGDKPSLIPPVYATLYGTTLSFAEPMQSTLEPLSQCVRFGYDTGNLHYVHAGSIYYLLRSFSSGKNIGVLIGEADICIRLAGSHFGNDSSFKTPSYILFIRFFFTPLYNVLHELEGESLAQDALLMLDHVQPMNNQDSLKAAIDSELFNFVLTILVAQVPCDFCHRNMERALTYSNMYHEYFIDKPTTMLSGSVTNVFYDGLINFYFMRQTGREQCKVRGEKALNKLNEWLAYSEWNFKNKHLLLEAEFHYSTKNSSMAATCYEASIEAACEHKFIQEEAIANELAGLFFLEEGKQEKALSYFRQSTACYRMWGAFAVARRVEAFIEMKFGISHGIPSEITIDEPRKYI